MTNHAHAEAAVATASFLTDNADLPEIACTEILTSHVEGAACASWQLSARADQLADLVTWADSLDGDVSALVLQRERPNAFVAVQILGEAAGVPVTVWTHLGEREAAALWGATGHQPEPGIRAHLSLDSLRAAAEVTTDAEVTA